MELRKLYLITRAFRIAVRGYGGHPLDQSDPGHRGNPSWLIASPDADLAGFWPAKLFWAPIAGGLRPLAMRFGHSD